MFRNFYQHAVNSVVKESVYYDYLRFPSYTVDLPSRKHWWINNLNVRHYEH